jgi:hypothetical protein
MDHPPSVIYSFIRIAPHNTHASSPGRELRIMDQNIEVQEVDISYSTCHLFITYTKYLQSDSSQCTVCNSRSNWDFLQEFYSRVDEAHQHSQRLEGDLRCAGISVEQSRFRVAQLERAVVEIQVKLDGERLEHNVTRHEISYEQQRHKETAELFDITYEAAQESMEIIADLRTQVTELQKHKDTTTSVIDLPVTERNLFLTEEKWENLESWLSANSTGQ